MDDQYENPQPGPSQHGRGQNRKKRGTSARPNAPKRKFGSRDINRQIPAKILHSNQHPPHAHQHRSERSFDRSSDVPSSMCFSNEILNQGTQNYIKSGHNSGQNDTKQQNYKSKIRCMGFKKLEELANLDSSDILVKINDQKDSFTKLIQSPIEKDDLFVLIMKLISKVCLSSFDELKLKLLLEICNSSFIVNLRNYLIDLPYAQKKASNSLYWNYQNEFWSNFILFIECIINMSPSTAIQKFRSLIDATVKCCLEGLSEKHGFSLPEKDFSKIAQLRARLTSSEEENKNNQRGTSTSNLGECGEPPEDFRQLSIIPSRDELLDSKPYLRPNIVNGAYKDEEHYLDIQFRLLREDCFGPLREGILQYLKEPTKKKFDHIRVYKNVKFIEPYISQNKFGSVIQLDEKTNQRLKRINWSHSKRFLFGSLLLFTKDNCATFIIATIVDRDIKYLSKGKIPVSLVDAVTTGDNIYNDDSYIMIESEVYFEPYFHVLKVLQDPKFPEHIAMKKYIVKVDPIPRNPAYLNLDAVYDVEIENSSKTKFKVLQHETWPAPQALGLNESQYQAYQLALTHEFAVIQGPPGTGKTYLGVKVAKTLLENLSDACGCLMLVICYTNHALDQFLECILPITNSIVRIGGQSRNEAMEKNNINNLRRNSSSYKRNKLFYEQRYNLKVSIHEMKQAQDHLDSLNNGVISYNNIKACVPDSQLIGQFYSGSGIKDPLKYWLFENMEEVDIDTHLLDETENSITEVLDNIDEDIYLRNDLILDDLEMDYDWEEVDVDQNIRTSFSLNEAETKLKRLISHYATSNNTREKRDLKLKIQNLKSHINLYKQMREHKKRVPSFVLTDALNLHTVSTVDRWTLYFRWAEIVINNFKSTMKRLQKSVQSANKAYEESRMMVDLEILKNTKVVGMTTSGAARLRKLLQALAPSIVIVEEAAEVLESHIVTSLTKDCQHLILIGDHQQLRPSAAHMKLARKYNMEISLFERMIMNSIHSRRLSVQHRMRPEIASLISPHIYSDLANHPTVEDFPDVRGITKNLFFLTHNYKEEEVDDSSSRTNHKEADLTLLLANYLMQQGYEPGDITILAAYSGQMFYMRNERYKYAYLGRVKITVLDNYQGEESKIILLSLVRNNNMNKIGFLGISNRICVALSRAKEGFYIFGNIDILKSNSELWTKIADTLEKNGSLGTNIRLKCEMHQTQITTISNPKDFEKVPEGGCLLKCNLNLKCGHRCPLICHGYDRSHARTPCPFQCERVICELGHVCPLRCAVKCLPCNRLVQKRLPCGHDKMVACHRDPADPAVKCTATVAVALPDCGHEVKKACYLDTKLVACTVRCVYRVERCGHECRRKCHVKDDPDHERPCAKAKEGCTASLIGDRGDHQCPKKCHETCDPCNIEVMKKRSTCKHSERVACCENVDQKLCRKNCARTLPCDHFCKKKCFEKCGDCMQKVKKIIASCKHEIEIECMKEATRELCRRKCERVLSCGHPCPDRCDKPCDAAKCTKVIQRYFDSPCGHKVSLPCNVYNLLLTDKGVITSKDKLLLENCMEACGHTLKCGHVCAGTCSQCRQGRLHAPCTQTCHQDNICGHRCEEPCNQVCPPCAKPCEVRCPHSRCPRQCGAPCVPCQEKCSRACRHGSCTRRCGEPCSRPPCARRCEEVLACGHRCRGLCGEPCPDICNICRPDDFPKDFLGDDFEDDDKFIKLEDCPHLLELENMDNLMMGDSEEVRIRTCPFCRKPIINTYRYKDLVNHMFKTEINPIKEKVYGTINQIQIKEDQLIAMAAEFLEKHQLILKGNINWKNAFNKINTLIKNQKKVSLLQLEMHFIYFDILDMIGDCYKKYVDDNLTALKDELFDQIKIICNVLMANIKKISQQQQQDIRLEIKRLNAIIQLSKISSHAAYLNTKTVPKVKEATATANKAVLTWNIFKEDVALEALKQLQNAVKMSGIVSKHERDLIVKAVGVKSGAWYKCPNGHFYCIGECGGAMQVGKCIECGAAVGGQSHRLLSTNSLASEMDGSRFAAWSEQYNNMANFDFD